MVKGVLAGALLIVLVALGVLLWKAFLRSGASRGRPALASAAAVTSVLALVSLAAVMANIQERSPPSPR